MRELISRLPQQFNRYYEPFVGGGALFFELQKQLTDTFLSDSNFDLVVTYKVIQQDVDILIEKLRKHAKNHGKDYYYRTRKDHDPKNPVDRAARFIYLNRTCYNGLWRVNSKGEFNVPMGRYKNPSVVQEDKLRACNEALQHAQINYWEFNRIAPGRGDFVYCDPPYHPTDNTSFTRYSKLDFTEHDQVRLKDFAKELHDRGVQVMLSNSDTKFIRDIYNSKVFTVERVEAPRLVNCKPGGRGKRQRGYNY